VFVNVFVRDRIMSSLALFLRYVSTIRFTSVVSNCSQEFHEWSTLEVIADLEMVFLNL